MSITGPRVVAFWGVVSGICALIATAYVIVDHLPPLGPPSTSAHKPVIAHVEYQDELILQLGRFVDLDTNPPSVKDSWDDTVDLYSGREYWSIGLYLFAVSEMHDVHSPVPTKGTAAIAVWGEGAEPTYAQCRDWVVEKGWDATKQFAVGSLLCLLTDQHRVALLRIEAVIDDRVTLSAKVWNSLAAD